MRLIFQVFIDLSTILNHLEKQSNPNLNYQLPSNSSFWMTPIQCIIAFSNYPVSQFSSPIQFLIGLYVCISQNLQLSQWYFFQLPVQWPFQDFVYEAHIPKIAIANLLFWSFFPKNYTKNEKNLDMASLHWSTNAMWKGIRCIKMIIGLHCLHYTSKFIDIK